MVESSPWSQARESRPRSLTIPGADSHGHGFSQLRLTFASSGVLLVTTGNQVFEWTPSGGLTVIAGTGQPSQPGPYDGQSVTALSLNIGDVAADDAGNVYLTEQYLGFVLQVDPAGIVSTLAGNGASDPLGDGGPATAASISSPYGIAVNAAGEVFVADGGHRRIRKIVSGVISTYAGGGNARGDGWAGVGGWPVQAVRRRGRCWWERLRRRSVQQQDSSDRRDHRRHHDGRRQRPRRVVWRRWPGDQCAGQLPRARRRRQLRKRLLQRPARKKRAARRCRHWVGLGLRR